MEELRLNMPPPAERGDVAKVVDLRNPVTALDRFPVGTWIYTEGYKPHPLIKFQEKHHQGLLVGEKTYIIIFDGEHQAAYQRVSPEDFDNHFLGCRRISQKYVQSVPEGIVALKMADDVWRQTHLGS